MLRFGRASYPAFAIALAVCAAGCKKDEAKCDQALSVTRQAIVAENFASAQQWRDYAWRNCDDKGALESLDRELVTRKGEAEARQKAADARAQEKNQLVKLFLEWVRDNRAAPDRASGTPLCDPLPESPGHPASKERFCTATRNAGTHPLQVRYWEDKPELARFVVKLPDATSCEEVGATKVLKTWAVPANEGKTAQRFRCEFVSGPLASLQVVLSQAVNADLHVFNPGYLEKDPALRGVLEGP